MSTVKDLVATNADAATGSVVYWQLSGVVELSKLKSAWMLAGLDENDLPSATSPKTALRRAMDALADGKKVLVKQGSTPDFIGLYERRDGGKVSYELQFEARLNANALQDPYVRDAHGTELNDERSEAVEIGFAKELRAIHHHDLSGWIVSMVRKHLAVSLRESGGFYFIPRGRMDSWRAVCAAVESVTKCSFYELPAMNSSQAAEAILDALTREVGEYVQGIDDQIGKVGVRALASREREVQDYEARISTYEAVIGQKLDALRGKMAELGGRLAMAKMANTSDE